MPHDNSFSTSIWITCFFSLVGAYILHRIFAKTRPALVEVIRSAEHQGFILRTASGQILTYSEYTNLHDYFGTSPMEEIPHTFNSTVEATDWAHQNGYQVVSPATA